MPQIPIPAFTISLTIFAALTPSLFGQCTGEEYHGVCFPDGASSFADAVIQYDPLYSGGPASTRATDPLAALAPPDNGWVSLGNGGLLEVLFTDNVLTNSGDDNLKDIWVFEFGEFIEESLVAIKPHDQKTSDALLNAGFQPDPHGWYSIGSVGGSTSGIDIDQWFPGFPAGSLIFDAVQIVDDPNQGPNTGDWVGADIDAIGVISSTRESDNLLVNPNAENGITGWAPSNGGFTTRDFDPPAAEGQFYFYGGPDTVASSAFQDVDVSAWATTIDQGEEYYYFRGLVAQWHSPPPLDLAVIRIECVSPSGAILDSWESDSPQSEKFFELRTVARPVPVSTRVIRVTMEATRQNGRNCDGYFDDLFLTLAPTRLEIEGEVSAQAGAPVQVRGNWAMPNAYAWTLFAGAHTPGAGIAIPNCPGLFADVSDVRNYRFVRTRPNGEFQLSGRLPVWLAGKSVYVQAVDPINCRLSNVWAISVL
jgi:hypothetical protein